MMSFGINRSTKDSESYALQIFMELSPQHQLKEGEFELDGKKYSVYGGETQKLLKISSFSTKKRAEIFANKLHGALLHMTVKRALSLQADFELQEPRVMDDSVDLRTHNIYKKLCKEDEEPIYSDRVISKNESHILPEHLNLMVMTPGTATVTNKIGVEPFSNWLKEGFKLNNPEAITKNEKLKLAIELYAASFYESGMRAKVINHVTVLEALLEDEKEKKEVIENIELLRKFLKTNLIEGKIDQAVFEKIDQKLRDDKDKSISSRIRKLILNEVDAVGMKRQDLKKLINKSYGIRSDLLHEGKADDKDIREVSSKIGQIVQIVLEQHILRTANI